MTRGKGKWNQWLGNVRSGPFAVVALLLAINLAAAGCSYGRSGAARQVTPPDPPPVPRAKPMAGAVSRQPEFQQASLGQVVSARTSSQRVHVITEGQSLYAVARLYDVSMPNLIQANQLTPPYKLVFGQQLVVPDPPGARTQPAETQVATQVAAQAAAPTVTPVAAPGVTPAVMPAVAQAVPRIPTHVVESGDTVYSIARRYQVDMDALVRLNTLPASYVISPGQRLLLPGQPQTATAAADKLTGGTSKLGSAAMSTEPTVQATDAAWTPAAAPAVAMMPPPAVTGPIPDAPPRASDKFLWPVQGELLLNYGPKQGGLHNDGINIAAPRGSPVLAAENGVVAYVGNELRGFGNLLLIKHDGDWMTAYAHNEAILVGRGARVERGQMIARVGDSGSVVTPQLHFEIRRGTRAVDPAKLLTPRQSAQKM